MTSEGFREYIPNSSRRFPSSLRFPSCLRFLSELLTDDQRNIHQVITSCTMCNYCLNVYVSPCTVCNCGVGFHVFPCTVCSYCVDVHAPRRIFSCCMLLPFIVVASMSTGFDSDEFRSLLWIGNIPAEFEAKDVIECLMLRGFRETSFIHLKMYKRPGNVGSCHIKPVDEATYAELLQLNGMAFHRNFFADIRPARAPRQRDQPVRVMLHRVEYTVCFLVMCFMLYSYIMWLLSYTSCYTHTLCAS